MQLDNDLQNVELGNLSINDYFSKINRLADLLANIDAPVDDKNLVYYVVNGLGKKYEQVAGIIRHRDPLPTFAQTQSMLLLEESRLTRKSNRLSALDSTSPSPHVLLAAALNNHNNSTGPLHGTWGPQIIYGPYIVQVTTLPQAFNAMTVQDYGDSSWYMDTGATSHLASDVGPLDQAPAPPM
nr:hybrid signal transduction histidine kinase M [Tanacetum cinerariifolium]